MVNLIKEKEDIYTEIKKRNYESLRYAVLGDKGLDEWQVRIDFNEEKRIYEVYSTMDRASVTGKSEFTEFEEARNCFFRKLELIVNLNRRKISKGEVTYYASPLWEEKEFSLTIDSIDAIGVVDDQLTLLIADGNLWLPDTEADHLTKLQEKINNYIYYIETKQYKERFGDNFDIIFIHLKFQYYVSDTGLQFLAAVSEQLKETNIRLKIEMPE